MYYILLMRGVDVEWDDDKNERNKREHEGLGFELAQLVFADPNRLERLDKSETNTSLEGRWQTLGMAGKVLMGITKSTVRVGQKPTKEQLKQIRAIAKKPINYTDDCPESTPEALAEFAKMARAQRKRKTKPVVALRIEAEALEKYKSLGNGYTGIMADVLIYVANNPEILSKASGVSVAR